MAPRSFTEIGNVVNLDKKRERLAPTENKKKTKRRKAGDFWLTALVLGLVVFGVMMVFSASQYYSISKFGTPFHYLVRVGFYAVMGAFLMLLLSAVDYHLICKFYLPIMGISLAMLVLLFTPLGVTINHATRWLDLKVITLMPGEIAKPAMIIFVSTFLAAKDSRPRDFLRGAMPVLALTGIVGILIAKQPNTSTAATVVIIVLGILFVAGIQLIYALIAAVGGGAAFLWYILSDEDGYRMKRVLSFLHPFDDPKGDGYQVIQGLLAMGSGGLFGVGLGKSVQKTLYLPEPQNDFILAIIGEEIGYVGLMLLLCAYLILIWRCVHICMNAPDKLGTYIASGITVMLAMQVIFNVMVVTSMMPPTGVILPFVSYGGNALLIFMGCMGIMLNISSQSK